MRPRAWIYVLSIIALLVPAGGIAYLGVVSYRDERGAVSAQTDRQRATAGAIAERISAAIERALTAIERATADGGGARAVSDPLARYWFWIGSDQQLRMPQRSPAQHELGGGAAVGTSCAAGHLEDCERELQTRTRRRTQLRGALRAEAAQNWADAKRMFVGAAAEDTEPEALLGLARVYTRLHDSARAEQTLGEVERKFGDRAIKGLPLRLVVAMVRAEARGPTALLDLADAVLAASYPLDPVVRLGVVTRIGRRIDELAAGQPLGEGALQRRRQLEDRLASVRNDARAAAGLADDVGELARTAATSWRGRPSGRDPGRTLIYRRRDDRSVIGFAVDAAMLESVVRDAAAEIAPNARPLVLAAGAAPPSGLRTIVQVPLGTPLPHLSLAVVNPLSDLDPLDEVIRKRSRQHVLYTSALAILLGLGLIATIRGAARARELARLKSDFVSTVSHELKTPLTSIRMFAEMLEQGVAQGDSTRMARYHGVIVQQSQRLGLLIANLLDYAQIERGTRRYSYGDQVVEQLATQAVDTFETLRDPEQGPRNDIAVTVSPAARGMTVSTDRDVVVQAVLNLISNAAKYGGDGKPIEVAVDATADGAAIAVRDHGPGIPSSEHGRIFREFYRAPEAYRSGVEGTGLGLALVKQHIEALGGTVSVESTVGEGATFTIRLPRTPVHGGAG